MAGIFCSCSYWVSLPSIKIHRSLLEATIVAVAGIVHVVVVDYVAVALLVVADHIIYLFEVNKCSSES